MPKEVLLVEDSPGDIRLTREAFSSASSHINLHVVHDGVEAMAFLRREGAYAKAPRPDFILLDWNLPKMDGREVLAQIKRDDALKSIPTVVLTTSDAETDIVASYKLQANCYVSKPVQLDEFDELIKSICDFWLKKGQAAATDERVMSNRKIRNFLLVEDNPGDARLLREMLNEQGASDTHLTHVTTMLEAERYIAEHQVDVILLDLGLPDAQGVAGIQRAQAIAPAIPLVVLTGLDDEVLAEQALQEGAQDYLIKGQIETRGILRALRYAVERKRLDQLKNDFVSTVSHELRTPLTSIAGSLGLLIQKMSDDLPVSMHRLLSIAYTNSQRLVRLVNDILDIEKMESGQVVFNFRRVELRALVEQAIEANRGFADAHNVRLRFEDCGEVNAVRADPDRLAQVITNLLSNAIKFSPADREVVVSIMDVGDFVHVAVRDHGSGVPIGFRATIFEKFAQADTTNTRQKGGTGLGLSIVKRIVDRLGGTVGFADAPGGGAIFHIELPRWGHVPHALIDQRTQRPIAPALSSVQRSPRILHINDENAIEQALNKFGDVVSVSSFGAAHIASEASDFDLAVIDAAQGTNRNNDAPLCLRDSKGNEIPVIECFARRESLGQGESAQSAPAKSCASIEELVAIVRDRLSSRSAPVPEEAA